MRVRPLLGIALAVLALAGPAFAQATPPGEHVDRFAHVKNLILNQVTYNCCRLQEVWLDK